MYLSYILALTTRMMEMEDWAGFLTVFSILFSTAHESEVGKKNIPHSNSEVSAFRMKGRKAFQNPSSSGSFPFLLCPFEQQHWFIFYARKEKACAVNHG
ncbi:hypothetical protein AVEN_214053-1 [Araneus ventricosus]|uniref:Uncharacterized protein n=1 Tax=Araneus ventricosus TaxID=182803 RepID=A0A4Y2WVS6_ARAVE|nr:hypothetical protein AVEN_214053-1 [Araneus ventricosus]